MAHIKLKIVKGDTRLEALPWNGWYNGTEMINTCTADNLIFFFHTLQLQREDTTTILKNSYNESFVLLNKLHNLFKEGNFNEGKYLWLSQFFSNTDQWDAYGLEHTYSFCKLDDIMTTTYRSSCSNAEFCSRPTRILLSKMIGCENRNAGAASFEHGIRKWMCNSSSTQCPYMSEDGSTRCSGVRITSHRQFESEPPMLFYVELSTCLWPRLPPHLNLQDDEYTLKMITYGNNGHFCCAMHFQKQWWLYDGLKKYHNAADGLSKIKRPAPPAGYTRSHCIYVKN